MKYLILILALIFSPAAAAESYYVVGGIGQAQSTSPYVTTQDMDAYQAGVGVRFDSNAIEAVRHKMCDDERCAFATAISATHYFEMNLGHHSENMLPLLKVGIAKVKTPFKEGVSRTGLTYGLGLSFNVSKNSALQITAESLNTGVETIGRVPVFAARLLYSF